MSNAATGMKSERRLDPEIVAKLPEMPTTLDLDAIEEFRAVQVWPDVPESDAVERFERVVPADPEVTLRIFRPRPSLGAALPCVYWIHGGGMIRGSYISADADLQRWVERFPCIAVAVKYRLAPESPYPAAMEDCYAGLVWLHDNADELGIDTRRLGIAGYSAGAGLAAGLALLARDRGTPPVAFQLLKQAMIDDRGVTPSSRWQVPPWYPAVNVTAWRAYLGELAGGDDVPVYAAPARATDLAGLPPAFVQVGAADTFVDENIAYAQELNHAGVPTELHVYQDAPHGFDLFAPDSAVGRRAIRDTDEWLAQVFGASGAS